MSEFSFAAHILDKKKKVVLSSKVSELYGMFKPTKEIADLEASIKAAREEHSNKKFF